MCNHHPFINESLSLLFPFTHFSHPLVCFPNHQCVLCIYVFISVSLIMYYNQCQGMQSYSYQD